MKKMIEVEARLDEFSEIRRFVEKSLKEKRIPDSVIREGILVIEEVFVRILENGVSDDDRLSIWINSMLGEVRIMIGYNGDRFDIDFHGSGFDPGAVILRRYEDKIALTYRKRSNTIAIRVRRSYDRVTVLSVLGIILASLVYMLIRQFAPETSMEHMGDKFVMPVMEMFTNAMIMISTPVTLLSLIKNITDVVVITDNRLNVSRLIGHAARLSIITTFTAAVCFYVSDNLFLEKVRAFDVENVQPEQFEFDDFMQLILSAVPQNLMEIFAEFSPLPTIFIGTLTAAAICTCNKYFENLKTLMDSLDSLVCKMLNIIMLFLPVAAFMATLNILIEASSMAFVEMLGFAAVMIVGIGILVIIRLFAMRCLGIDSIAFARNCVPAIWDNLKINHNIDAVPYNIRFCSRKLGISVRRLNVEMPILAQISLAGNCFIVMFIGMYIITGEGIDLNFLLVITMAMLVIALSVGAPGQDGTLIIGLIVLCALMGVDCSNRMPLIIFSEVIFGRLISLVNVLSDIATVETNEFMEKKREKKRNNI